MRRILLALILTVAACSSPTPGSGWRLLEHGDEVERRWPEGVSHEPPVAIRRATIAPSKRFKLYEVEMRDARAGRDARVALLAPAGTSYEVGVRLPPEPELRLALGYLQLPEAPPEELTFRVSVRTADEAAVTILDESLAIEAEGAWRDRILPLDRWQGREVLLRFATAGAAAWGAWGAPEITRRDGRATGWNLVLISLDTLRADHLGCYGYHRQTSPNLDALAARGIRFATVVSQCPWTRPSHKALFSGVYPASRGGLDSPFLAQILWQAGYRTGALTGGGQVDHKLGFMAGFETYRVQDWLHRPELVLRWLEADRGRPGFLFLHTYEVHDAYTDRRFAEGMPRGRLPESFAKQTWWHYRRLAEEERAYVEALYDGDIAFTDDRLGVLLRELQDAGLLRRTVIVVTSDHGEQFWEHGSWRHGSTMYDHDLLVPLIVHLPPGLRARVGGEQATVGAVIEQQVSLVDIYPTLLDLLDIELDHEIHGRSVLPLLAGRELEPGRAFAENTNIRTWERKTLRTDRYKFILSYPKKANEGGGTTWELYDLARDPGERHNLVERHPEAAARLFAEIEAIRGRHEQLEEELPADISPQLRREIEALGYFGVD
jgi:arylsulfatase A-like enzyme